MTGTLNTTVPGSPGTCVAGGDALNGYAGNVQMAGDQSRRARTVARSGWEGPAHDAFDRVTLKPTNAADDLAFTCQEAMRTLKDFASSLSKVQEKMINTIREASGGGLEVQGPLILPPNPPPPKPSISGQASSAADATDKYEAYQTQMRAWVPIANEYNRKVELFNKCSDNVRDARLKEDEAHAALRGGLGPITGKNVGDVGFTFGTGESVTIASALGLVQSTEGERHDAFIKQQRHLAASTLFQRFATGNIVDLTDAEKAILTRAAAQSGATAETYAQRVRMYEKWISGVPQEVRAAVASYPSFSALKAANSGLAAGAHTALKATPYVGSVVTIGMEAWNAKQGTQSWPKAAAKAGAAITGTTAGSVAGAVLGSFVPVPGATVVGGVVGGVFGGWAGSYVVDRVAPGADPYAQPRADSADTTMLDRSKIVQLGPTPTPPPLPR